MKKYDNVNRSKILKNNRIGEQLMKTHECGCMCVYIYIRLL